MVHGFLYMYQTSGGYAGMCMCDWKHQMKKTDDKVWVFFFQKLTYRDQAYIWNTVFSLQTMCYCHQLNFSFPVHMITE